LDYQEVVLADHRLLRRNGGQLDHWDQPGRWFGQHDAGRSHRDGGEHSRSARGPLRPRRPLPLAGLAIKNERREVRPLDVSQGMLTW